MKKILYIGLALFLFIPVMAFAGRIFLTIIGPTNATSRVTVAAAGAGIRNCLTDVDVISDAAGRFRILDGGTTVYAVDLSSGGSLVRSWSELSPMCGSANTVFEMYVSAGNFNINYTGFTGQ